VVQAAGGMQKNIVYELRKMRKEMEVSRDTNSCNEQGTNVYVYLPKEICRQACK